MHPDYAQALAEFGEPRELAACGAWVLVRLIPGGNARDAMGCYPRMVCQEWNRIHEDLAVLRDELVSMVLVSDPFAEVEHSYLLEHFDVVRPFKHHRIVRLDADWESRVAAHHRYYARRALRKMDVEIVAQPATMIDEWCELYRHLTARHRIRGVQAFSRSCFETMLKLPGVYMAVGRLKKDNAIAGMHLTIKQGVYSYAHLAAFSDEGYEISASYGIYWKTIEFLRESGCRFMDFGGAVGNSENGESGLTKFKDGWSQFVRTAYLCGKIFDKEQYNLLCEKRRQGAVSNYFPAYRANNTDCR